MPTHYRTIQTPQQAVSSILEWAEQYLPLVTKPNLTPTVMISSGTDSLALLACLQQITTPVYAVTVADPGTSEHIAVHALAKKHSIPLASISPSDYISKNPTILKDIILAVNSAELWTVASGLVYKLAFLSATEKFGDSLQFFSGMGADNYFGDGLRPTPDIDVDPDAATMWLEQFSRTSRESFIRSRGLTNLAVDVDFPTTCGGYPVTTPFASSSFSKIGMSLTATAAFGPPEQISTKEPLRLIAERSGFFARSPKTPMQSSSGMFSALAQFSTAILTSFPDSQLYRTIDQLSPQMLIAQLSLRLLAEQLGN